MIEFEDLSADLLEWARELHNDPEVLAMLTDPTVVSEEQQVAWFFKLQSTSKSRRLTVLVDDKPAGLVRLDDIDPHNHSICVGLDIHRDFRGKGLAKPVYRALFKYLFEKMEMNRVWLLVADYNERAKTLYTQLGFVTEGIYREALFKNNQYYDYILMSVLRKEWLAESN